MSAAYVNRFGRKPTRGLRPWLLVPKIIFVAGYLGGLASALAIWHATGFTSIDPADPRRLWTVNLLGRMFVYLVVPSLLGAIIFGVALLLQHPIVFLRLRWLQLKLIALPILIISAHFFIRSRLTLLREAAVDHTANPSVERQFIYGLTTVLLASIAIVVLARLKPRLRQNPARAVEWKR